MLPEIREAEEDPNTIQREYMRSLESREVAKKAFERREQMGKENQIVGGLEAEISMDVDEGPSTIPGTKHATTVRGIRRTDTEELFN
jgi:hypothetical protein